MKKKTFITKNPRETYMLGKKIAKTLRKGTCLFLTGELGSGENGVCKRPG